MTTKKTKRLHNQRRDDAATVIAELFDKTPDYIRQVIRDERHIRYKGKRSLAIRQAYLEYKNSKQAIIAQLQHYKKNTPLKQTA